MRREARQLLEKAGDSLILGIEIFNRPNERGRVTATLILIDHAFEMLLKAAILHRGGTIREKGRENQTISFTLCVRRALSDSKIAFLSQEQSITLQALNSLRDAAQHHLVTLSEESFYLHTQTAVTLFGDLLNSVFEQKLVSMMPARVLPISTRPPVDLLTLFAQEHDVVRQLLRPGGRKAQLAEQRLRAMVILDRAVKGEEGQPSEAELKAIARDVRNGRSWRDLFPGVAAINITVEGTGPAISLRLSKQEGVAVKVTKEGDPGAAAIAIRRVNDTDVFTLGLKDLAKKLSINEFETSALVYHLGIKNDKDAFKVLKIGASKHPRYSQKALDILYKAKASVDMIDVRAAYSRRKKGAASSPTANSTPQTRSTQS
jgi:hypothetical protein